MADVFSLRIPAEELGRMRDLARAQKTGVTQLARSWISERIRVESARLNSVGGGSVVREPSTTYCAGEADLAEKVRAICKRRGVKMLALCGSAARDDFSSEHSDLDFVVEFLAMPSGLGPDAYFGLQEDLQSLYGRPVDLIEQGAIRNPYVKESIDRDKKLVYDDS